MAQLRSTSITGSFNIYNENDENFLTTASGNWWYNPSTGKLNYTNNTVTRAWSTSNNQVVCRGGEGGAGTQNAGLAFGGLFNSFGPYGPYVSCTTQEYNGTVWEIGGNMISSRYYLGGAGTQNEGLAIGGVLGPTLACTEEYNGISWAVGGALINARQSPAGAGTQNLGLTFGGGGQNSCTEEYNGSTWSAGGALITARAFLAGAGTQNAGLAFGGCFNTGYPYYTSTVCTCTEEYNGSTWSAGGAMILGRNSLAGAGTQNEGLAFGGIALGSVTQNTEIYNGISWSSGGSMISWNYSHAGVGSQARALSFSGENTTQCTFEYCINYNIVEL